MGMVNLPVTVMTSEAKERVTGNRVATKAPAVYVSGSMIILITSLTLSRCRCILSRVGIEERVAPLDYLQ